jgi:hypothetical protein
MTDLRAAAQQALEALENSRVFVTTREKIKHPEGTEWYDERITALRAALEQPERANPWRDAVDHELSTLHMAANDDPRESIRRLIDWHCAVQIDPLVSSAAQELIERGKREALEQPEQEPVAWFNGKPLYHVPPRREWQGLTEEEIQSVIQLEREKRFQRRPPLPLSMTELSHAIEAALRSKNHE